MFEHILVAVDGSEHAAKAVDLAADLAARYDAELTVLNVMVDAGASTIPPELEQYAALEHVFVTERDLLENAARAVVETAANRVAEKGLTRPGTKVVVGRPAPRIVEVAEETEADLIVLGSRGLGALESMLLGSTSHKVAHLAPCTVVAVK